MRQAAAGLVSLLVLLAFVAGCMQAAAEGVKATPPAASPAVATPDPAETRVALGHHECCYGFLQAQDALWPRYVFNGVARSGEWKIGRAAYVPVWK